MKKTLLTAAASLIALAASADVIVDVDQNYAGMTEFPYYQMGFAPDMVDGKMVVTNAEEKGFWEVQYFVCYPFQASSEFEYTVTSRIKSNAAGAITVVLGNWDTSVNGQLSLTADNEWHEVSTKISGVPAGESFVIFQSGNVVGTYEVEWVKVTHESDPVVIPETGDIVASYYTGNGQTFGGWGDTATVENVDEDGKPCLKYTNTGSDETWKCQLAIDVDLDFDKTYYLGFDVKGNAATGLDVAFQNKESYAGKGSMTKFDVTPEWAHVIVYGAPTAGSDATALANRIIFNLGKYVGTMYITNVTLYTESTGSVISTVAETPTHYTVYTLTGVRVLDTDDASALDALRPGLYIVNGKKTAIINR